MAVVEVIISIAVEIIIIPTSKKKAVRVCSIFSDYPKDRADIINFFPFMKLLITATVGHQF